MDRCALLAGFAVLAAVADQPDSLTVCFVEDQRAAVGRTETLLIRTSGIPALLVASTLFDVRLTL